MCVCVLCVVAAESDDAKCKLSKTKGKRFSRQGQKLWTTDGTPC